jgi:hypothetical protein
MAIIIVEKLHITKKVILGIKTVHYTIFDLTSY